MNFSKSFYRYFFVILFVFLTLVIFYKVEIIKNKVINKEASIVNKKYEKILIVNTSLDTTTKYENNEKITGLEDFIKLTLSLNKGLQVQTENSMFSHLNEKVLSQDEWVNKESLADYSVRVKKLKKMQRLALHISGNYKVPLIKAEKIVYASFVEANKKNLDPTLVLSLISVESTFNQFSKSQAGAVGLTQVMPNIHKDKIARLPDEDIWSVHNNIKVGTDILKEYLNVTKGNIALALQRYNGSLHDESLNYSTKVFNKMNNLSKI